MHRRPEPLEKIDERRGKRGPRGFASYAMKYNGSNQYVREQRSEPRKWTDVYYSVEFKIEGVSGLYQFKLRDLSQRGMCIVVHEDSVVLKHLQVGSKLKMRYRSADRSPVAESFQTEIRHITREQEDRFAKHVLVGLAIADAPLL
jgi:hypothetical protein